ncbi:MAG: YjbQ family protein [Gemmatimonadetes bacterium]|nr:YjbQ family protein [Gemmatimonadota bacterium]
MLQHIRIDSREREELVDVTAQVRQAIRASGIRDGVVHLWALHTTCALTVNEGADPEVAGDIVRTLRRLVPQKGDYRHTEEGNADSHIKTTLVGPGLTLLVDEGEPVLGTWQKVFLAEWDGPRKREIAVRVVVA